jgi:hypothetical protein
MTISDHDFQVQIEGVFNASTHLLWSNVLAVNLEDSTDPIDALGAIFGPWTDVILPHQCANVTLTNYTVRRPFGASLASGPLTGTGGGGDVDMPSNVALVFTHHTATAGPTGKGRTFLAYMDGMSPDLDNPSIWSSSTSGSYASLMSDFLTAVNGGDHSPVLSVASKKDSALHPITSSTLNNTPGQMGPRRYG